MAPQFPLIGDRFVGVAVRTFFENLLPEGEALDDVVSAIHLRGASSFEVLGRLGAELPGVLSLLPEDARPESQQEYRPLSYESLSARLADRGRTPLLVSNVNTTMSLAGAQDKIGCSVFNNLLCTKLAVCRVPDGPGSKLVAVYWAARLVAKFLPIRNTGGRR